MIVTWAKYVPFFLYLKHGKVRVGTKHAHFIYRNISGMLAKSLYNIE